MPLYEYECARCGRFELIQKFSDLPLSACPTCGQEVQKLLSAPAIQFKGTGWYVTDYARKGGSSAGNGETASSGDGGKSAGDSKSGDGGKSGDSKSGDGGKSGDSKSGDSKSGDGSKSDSGSTSSPQTSTSKDSAASGSSSSK